MAIKNILELAKEIRIFCKTTYCEKASKINNNYQEESIVKMILSFNDAVVPNWTPYNWENKESHPTKYGKYFICRKDGKIHWETWNGSAWAYNHKEIIGWIDIPSVENLLKEREDGTGTES